MGMLEVILLAVIGAALLIGGAVGYFKFKGSTAKTISAAAAAAGIAIWAIILFVTPVFQETTGNSGPEETGIEISVTDYSSFVAQLTNEGVAVKETGELVQPFFSITGYTIKADEQDIQIFEYAHGGAMAEDAGLVSPDGFSVGTTMLNWIDSPHFYKAGRIIVIYIGDDADIINTLEHIIGPQFAGR